jgi:hypothetical protein
LHVEEELMWNHGLHWWCQSIHGGSQEVFKHPEASFS